MQLYDPRQISKYRSMAFKLIETGAFALTLLKMLIKTKNTVTSTPMRPGTTSGLMMKDAHETTTNIIDVR